jgi:uncharacterized protein (DUF1778 family)
MSTVRSRSSRIEVRATADERTLIDRAVAEEGTDLTTFVLRHTTEAARKVLADRDEFVLDEEQQRAWDAINDRPARDLPGLRALFERPSPFTA